MFTPKSQPLTLRDIQEADVSYLRFVIENRKADATTHSMIQKELYRRAQGGLLP